MPWLSWSLSSAAPGPVLMCSSPQGQDLALAFVEFHQVPLGPALQPVQVSLDGSTAFWCISHSSQRGIISKLAEVTLYPIIQVIDEYIKQD